MILHQCGKMLGFVLISYHYKRKCLMHIIIYQELMRAEARIERLIET